jgi:hypothetical protein
MKYRIEEQVFDERYGSLFYIQQSHDGLAWDYEDIGPFSYIENARTAMNQLMDKVNPKNIKTIIHHYP